MWGGRFCRVVAAVLVLCSPFLSSDVSAKAKSPARVAKFSKGELQALDAGKIVKRKFMIGRGENSYHAGLAYKLVDGSPMDVIRVLRGPGEMARVIPYGISAHTMNEEKGTSTIRVHQGRVPVTGSYTVRMRWDLSTYQARFWLDPSAPHDVRDMWGSFSAKEVRRGKTLVCFGFAFDIGGIGTILEGKAQRWALDVPERIASRMKTAN